MTTKYFVYPYTNMSAGAIVLAEELDGKRIKLTNSNYSPKPDHVIINWGNGNCPYPQALNPADAINEVIDKVSFFNKASGSSYLPKYATTKAAAANLSFPVVCRKSTEGHDGEGIVIADTAAQLVNAGLYTEYMDKTSEYRIHLGRLPNGEVVVIARQKKYKSAAFTGDSRIWTGQETKLEIIETAVPEVVYAAKDVFGKFPGLHFGAFDIVYNNSTEKAYVLEINSAPMLTASVAEAYGEFFKSYKGTETETPAAPITEHVAFPPQSESSTSAPYPAPTPAPLAGSFSVSDFVKAQIKEGHLTLDQLKTYMPPVTEEALISNYVGKLLGQ